MVVCRTKTYGATVSRLTENSGLHLFVILETTSKMFLTGYTFLCGDEITGGKMNTNDMMAEIRDANLSYLMLAQQMIRSDRATAIFRLGISQSIADLLAGLSNPQLLKLASSNMMLARFRFEDSAILGMLTNYNKERSLTQSHAAILMAGQPVEDLR